MPNSWGTGQPTPTLEHQQPSRKAPHTLLLLPPPSLPLPPSLLPPSSLLSGASENDESTFRWKPLPKGFEAEFEARDPQGAKRIAEERVIDSSSARLSGALRMITMLGICNAGPK